MKNGRAFTYQVWVSTLYWLPGHWDHYKRADEKSQGDGLR